MKKLKCSFAILFARTLGRLLPRGFVVLIIFALSLLTLPLFFPTRVSTPAYAATSDNLNFQARLETASGAIVPDGLYDVEFKLYSVSSGGTALWTEARTGGNQVRSVNGYITVNLGSVTSFPANMPWDQQLWLTMNVNSDGEMSPRLKLTAVPYAFNAKTASQLATSSGSNLATLSIAAPVSGNQTFVLQDQGSAGTYNIVTDGNASSLLSGSFVQNQNVSVQSTSKFWISDAGRSDTGFLAPSFDTATAAALNIGTTNATTINLNQNTVIAANKNITYATGTGNFDQSASSGTFATGTGAVSLNGDTTVASGKNLTVTSGTTSLTGTTNLNTSGSAATNIGNASSTTTVTGTTNVNTSGSATTTIGNSSATNNIVGTTGITGSTSINTTGTASTTIGSATGGAVSIAANAASSFTTTTGALTLTSAAAATWGTNAGLMTLQGAGGTTVTSTAGTTSSNVSITTGNASAGASGNISIDTGTATTTAGTISIGTTNASAVTIGRPTTTTTIQGNTVVTLNATSGTNFVCQNASNQLSTCTNTPLTSGTGIQNQFISAQASASFWIGGNGRIEGQTVLGGSSDQVQVVVRAGTGQTNNIMEFQNSAGIALSSFGANGQLTLGRVTTSGTTQAGVLRFADGTTDGFAATVTVPTLTADRKYVLPDTALATTASPATICVYNGTSSNCPAATGSTFYLWNSTTVQDSSNFYLRSAATGSVVGVLEGANGQTADLLRLNTYNGSVSTTVARFTAAGNLQVAGSVDTVTATALNIAGSNATTINLNQNTVIAANKNITYATGTGNFDQSASSGTFATGTGAVSLNGDTTVASGKNLTVTSGTTSLTGTTNLNTSGSAATNIGNASSTTTVTGTTNVNTSGSATTTIGNSSATNNIVGTTGITGSTSINTTGTASTTIGSATGGAVSIAANAASSFTTTTGALTLTSAAAATWGTNAGLMTLQGAGGTTVTSTAGTTSSNVSITTGNASAGASGNISIDTGTATTTAGTISIGTTNASAVTIGRPTTTTTIQGNTVVTLNATSGTNFVCQNASNQLSTCTNTPLTSGTGIQNQNTSVQLTSKFWISDAGRSDTGFLAPSFDTASAGTLSIGNANATTINVGTNATAHTINIGTGAAAQTIVIGSTSGASSLNLNSGAGGTVFNSSGGYSFQSGGTTTVSMDTSGVTLIKPTTNSTGALDVQNTTGNSIFRVDTTNQRAVASYMTAVYGTTTPTITFDTSASMINYTTPLGSNIPTRINIPNAVLNPYQQLIAIGLPSGSDATARAILVADARAGVHQPTIGVLSPDESNIFGFSWEGSNSTAYLKTLSGGIGLRSNTTDIATFQPTAINLNQNTTVTANLQIGSTTTDGTANILILDSYNSATEPTGYNGAMYYNTNLGKFRCYEAGAWKDCTASAAGYIQNQNASPQVANFWISGTARADTAIITPAIRATSDSTTAIQLQNASGTATALTVDTTNNRVGIGAATAPTTVLHVSTNDALTNRLPVKISQAGNGDSGVEIANTVQSYYMGIDTSDGNSFKLNSSTAAGGNYTAGYSSVGVNNTGAEYNYIIMQRIDTTTAGSISQVKAYVTSVGASPRAVVGIYADNFGNPGGQSLLATSNETTLTANSWNTFTFSTPFSVSANNTYWLAYSANGAAAPENTLRKDSSATVMSFFWTGRGAYSTTLPATASTTSSNTENYSIYAIVQTVTPGDQFSGSIMRVGNLGDTTFRTAGNTTTAFQVQNAANVAVFNVDTVNNRVGIGSGATAPAATLQVTGTLTSAGGAINLNASSNFATNINTGSSTGTVTIGNTTAASSTVVIASGATNGITLNATKINIGAATTATTIQKTTQTTAGAAGSDMTVQGATGNGAGAGGILNLRGGTGGATNANGGNVVITGGSPTGTGSQGIVAISTTAFTSAATQTFGTTGSLTAGLVDQYSTIPVNATAAGVTVTVPAPAVVNRVVGRLLYLSNVGSNDFNISLAGTSITIALKPNSTATLIWNGIGWTAAGASSSTDLQSAYNNTLTSAGGAELVLNPTGGAADGLTIRNNGTSPITGGVLEVQSSIGTNLFSVNSLATEWAANGGAENNVSFATEWTALGTAGAPTRTTTSGQYVTGQAGVATVWGTAAGNGIRNNLTTNPASGDILQVSFTAKLGAGSPISDLRVDYTPSGAATGTVCTVGQSLSSSIWTKITCEVVSPGAATNPDILIYQLGAAGSARTIYIDNLSVTRANTTDVPSNVQIGGGITGGQITLFTLDRSSTPPVENGDQTYLGSMYYDTTSGRIQCYEADGWGACGSAPDNIITLTPEYTGAVLNGNGVGTMTADFCANESTVLVATDTTGYNLCSTSEARNFYKWTSPQATSQTYGIYVTYKLPNTYKAFSDASTMKLTALTSDTTLANATLQVFRKNTVGGGITSCGAATTINSGNNVWQQTAFAGDETACGFTGGDYVIFKINVSARSNASVYVENLDFTYTNR